MSKYTKKYEWIFNPEYEILGYSQVIGDKKKKLGFSNGKKLFDEQMKKLKKLEAELGEKWKYTVNFKEIFPKPIYLLKKIKEFNKKEINKWCKKYEDEYSELKFNSLKTYFGNYEICVDLKNYTKKAKEQWNKCIDYINELTFENVFTIDCSYIHPKYLNEYLNTGK